MTSRTFWLASAATVLTLSVPASFAGSGGTQRASVSSQGAQATAASSQPALSSNGRYIAFVSSASDLVADDTNGATDVFVRNLKKGKTTRVSVGPKDRESDGPSTEPTISSNGRYIAFVSEATNLAKADTNDQPDVFVYDVKRKKTKRVTVGRGGNEPDCGCFQPVISGNGKFVAFASRATNLVKKDRNDSADVFVTSVKKRKITRVSAVKKKGEANGDSSQPAISANGRFVAFTSSASNFVKGDESGFADIFVRDVKRKKTVRVTKGLEGESNGDSRAPSISAKGKTVAYSSSASNLVEDDSNSALDVFVSGVGKGKPTRVSVASNGDQANDESLSPAISGNGKLVAFHSYGTNLTASDANAARDVFVYNVRSGDTGRVSVGAGSAEGDAESYGASITGNGRVVAFTSLASNLVPDDTNGVRDVIVR